MKASLNNQVQVRVLLPDQQPKRPFGTECPTIEEVPDDSTERRADKHGQAEVRIRIEASMTRKLNEVDESNKPPPMLSLNTKQYDTRDTRNT